MQTSLKTPTQSSFDKQVHTPPSVEHDNGKPKLLKSLSGKVFRRTPNFQSQQNATFDSSGLFVPGHTMSNKRSAPKPLNLSQPISPPPTLKKKNPPMSTSLNDPLGTNGLIHLESPIHLTPSNGIKSLEIPFKLNNLRAALEQQASYIPSTSTTTHEDTIIWTETADDPYLEEGSPTYLRSISQNISKVNSNGGHRRFIGSQCSMCDEKMSDIFSGEKVIELTCGHASHYQCYLTMFESTYLQKLYPRCRICHKFAKPTNEEFLEKMTSNLLTKQKYLEQPNYEVEQQWVDPRLSGRTSNGTLFTPLDQFIRTSDISSNGFRTPLCPLQSSFDDFDDDYEDAREDYDLAYENVLTEGVLLDQSMLNTASVEGNSNRVDLEVDKDLDLDPDVQINIDQNTSTIACSLTVKIPETNHEKQDIRKESEDDGYEDGKSLLMKEVQDFIKGEVDPDDELGALIMFDSIMCSTDGEHWNEHIMIYLFEKNLILFDREEMNTIGKVPLEQICQVQKLNQNTLIVDLKSRTLPEVYLSFPLLNGKYSLVKKWEYYIKKADKIPHFEQMTSTAWDILPLEMAGQLQHYYNDPNFKYPRPWETLCSDVLLQLIVCLNLSHSCYSENDECRNLIIESLKTLLNSLNDDDLLGLVIVGKNGSGTIGKYGTFIGTINKTWSCWEEFMDSLNVINHDVFDSPENELSKMLETCFRLVSTSGSMLNDEENSKFLKQIVLVRDGDHVENNQKHLKRITDDYNFDVMQIPSYNSAGTGSCKIINFENLIGKLHQRSIKGLTVKLLGQTFLFGNMAPGDEKTVICSFTNEQFDTMKTCECEIEWFDMKAEASKTVNRTVSIPNRQSEKVL